MRFRWDQALFIFWLIWLLILFYLVFPLWKSNKNEVKLVWAQNEIARLNAENEKLHNLLRNVQEELNNVKRVSIPVEKADRDEEKVTSLFQQVPEASFVDGPSREYEVARRKIRRNLNEFWFFVRAKLELGVQQLANNKSNQVHIQFNIKKFVICMMLCIKAETTLRK
jgi:regulatory protein YycI of two-component signal transduction system YycFG